MARFKVYGADWETTNETNSHVQAMKIALNTGEMERQTEHQFKQRFPDGPDEYITVVNLGSRQTIEYQIRRKSFKKNPDKVIIYYTEYV